MITLVENKSDREALLRLCKKTAFGCKIAGVVNAYGFDKGFACFWLDARAEVIYCYADDVMILSGTVVDPGETREFFRVIGPKAVFCAVRNAEALKLTAADSGDVLKKVLEPGEARQLNDDPYSVNIREIYTLLEQEGMVDEFEPFYLDLSHKLRHRTGMAFTEYRNEALAGCALMSGVGEDAAILSAVAVAPEFRRQGVGSALVRRAEAGFPGKTLYVFREKEKNKEFYKELGYVKTDTWVHSTL